MTRALILALIVACSSDKPADSGSTATPTAGSTSTGTTSDPVDADGDGVTSELDCDDSDSDRFPGNPEVCDGVDNDCNDAVDDGLDFQDIWVDDDGDGYGAGPASSTCDALPAGYADASGDCDDGDPASHPQGLEVCDGADNDCNGTPDDGLTFTTWYPDTDGDGWGDTYTALTAETCDGPPPGYAQAGDCDDTDATTSPTAPELCDGLDNDCDTIPDEDLLFEDWYADLDGDGAGDPTTGQYTCAAPGPDWVTVGDDCDDGDPDRFPGNPELCNGVDNDCDLVPDDGAPGQAWYPDYDADGYGDAYAPAVISCPPVGEHVLDNTDCDSTSPLIHPGAPTDTCDGVDTDCDGHIEDLAVPGSFPTINDALVLAVDGDVVCIDPGVYNEPVVLDGLDITLIGADAASTVLDGSGLGTRSLEARNSATVLARGLTVSGSTAGGIEVSAGATLELTDAVVEQNSCTNCRGAGLLLTTTAGDVVLDSVTVQDNTLNTDSIGGYSGGGISAEGGSLTLLDTVLRNNLVDCGATGSYGRAGGLNLDTDALIERTEIVGNRIHDCAISSGAGIATTDPNFHSAELYQVVIADNTHTAASVVLGGGVYAWNRDLRFENAILSGNSAEGTAQGSGGAVYAGSGVIELVNVSVTGNHVTGTTHNGAGLGLDSADTTLVNTTIDHNTGGTEGLYVAGGTCTASYGNLFANDGAPVTGIPDPTGTSGNLSVDPSYTFTDLGPSVDWVLTLQPGPLRDGGDPLILDANGTTSDIGAYGGPGQDWRDWFAGPT